MARSKKTILVVEDEAAIAEPLKKYFEKEGYEVLVAFDGAQGLEIGLKEKPDAIVLDILMPKMDGITMLEEIRRDEKWGADVPVVVLSNLDSSDPRTHNLNQLHPVAHLVKAEWPMKNVSTIIRRCLTEKTTN